MHPSPRAATQQQRRVHYHATNTDSYSLFNLLTESEKRERKGVGEKGSDPFSNKEMRQQTDECDIMTLTAHMCLIRAHAMFKQG